MLSWKAQHVRHFIVEIFTAIKYHQKHGSVCHETEDTTSATEATTSATEDTTSKRHHPVQEKDIKLPTMVSTETTKPAKIDEKIKPEKI
jgi:hypothetical protein